MHIKIYKPDGTTRAIWSKPFARVHRQHAVMPVRGSHVIAITDGPHAGMFCVDFSPLADLMHDDQYRVCLIDVFESHEEAVVAEHQWLTHNWVLS